MKTKTLEVLFILLVVLVFLLVVALAALNDADKKKTGFGKITGSFESFEVNHDTSQSYAPTKKNSERYDKKLVDYKDKIEEGRDNTFLR